MNKKGGTKTYLLIGITIVIIAIILFFTLFKSSTLSDEEIFQEIKEDIQKQFADYREKEGGNETIEFFQIVQKEKENKEEALAYYCGQEYNCEDIAIAYVKVNNEERCQSFTFIKIDGIWRKIDDNNADSSHCI